METLRSSSVPVFISVLALAQGACGTPSNAKELHRRGAACIDAKSTAGTDTERTPNDPDELSGTPPSHVLRDPSILSPLVTRPDQGVSLDENLARQVRAAARCVILGRNFRKREANKRPEGLFTKAVIDTRAAFVEAEVLNGDGRDMDDTLFLSIQRKLSGASIITMADEGLDGAVNVAQTGMGRDRVPFFRSHVPPGNRRFRQPEGLPHAMRMMYQALYRSTVVGIMKACRRRT